MMYGLITATTVTATILCVAIQRRHLMVRASFHSDLVTINTNLTIFDTHKNLPFLFLQVWGLFAPKFVFDVFGLILTDLLIFLASIYYFSGEEDSMQCDRGTED